MHTDVQAKAVNPQHEVGDQRGEKGDEKLGVWGKWENRCLMSPRQLGLPVFEVCLEEHGRGKGVEGMCQGMVYALASGIQPENFGKRRYVKTTMNSTIKGLEASTKLDKCGNEQHE